jgi:hypothetical protein
MTSTRSDGKGYIDETLNEQPLKGQFDDAELSGSSEEEESDLGSVEWAGEEPVLNFPQPEEQTGSDWDVEDEDWELAHGGEIEVDQAKYRLYQAVQSHATAAFRFDNRWSIQGTSASS